MGGTGPFRKFLDPPLKRTVENGVLKKRPLLPNGGLTTEIYLK